MTEKQPFTEIDSTDRIPDEPMGINDLLAKRDAELDMLDDEAYKLLKGEYEDRRRTIIFDFKKKIVEACEKKREDMKNNPQKYRTAENNQITK